MRKIAHAVILAAGRGSRMKPLTDVLPKAMAPFNGSTLVAEGIRKVLTRVPKVHITVGYKKAMLAQHVIHNGVSSVINTEGQSNSWWIHHTLLRYVNEPVYVLTADNISDLDFDLLEQSYYELDAPACMLVPVKPEIGLEGDFIFHEDQYVTCLDRNRPSGTYCSGIQILNPAAVCRLTLPGEDFYSIWQQLIAKRALRVSSVYPRKWISVDTLEQLAQVNSKRSE